VVIDGVQSLHDGSPVNIGNKKPDPGGSDSTKNKAQEGTRKMDSSKNK